MSTRLLAFVAKIFITELSPKYEFNVYDFTTSFVPVLLPLISRVFSFIHSVPIYFLTQNQCVNPFKFLFLSFLLLNVPPTLFTRKGTNNSRMFTIIQSIHHRTYLLSLIKMDLCNGNLHSYLWVVLQ